MFGNLGTVGKQNGARAGGAGGAALHKFDAAVAQVPGMPAIVQKQIVSSAEMTELGAFPMQSDKLDSLICQDLGFQGLGEVPAGVALHHGLAIIVCDAAHALHLHKCRSHRGY